ncbi:hypothetical protein [Novosphingobium sp.]|uniref:hypothetical protein n=1 Tax=Novosphingobium sp. TaxID=1874826 RepID=UPI003BA86962
MASYPAAEALRDGQLAEILKPFIGGPIPGRLAHTGPLLVPPKRRAFLDVAAPRLRASLGALPR